MRWLNTYLSSVLKIHKLTVDNCKCEVLTLFDIVFLPFTNSGCSSGIRHYQLPELWESGGLVQHGEEGQWGIWYPARCLIGWEQKWVLHILRYTNKREFIVFSARKKQSTTVKKRRCSLSSLESTLFSFLPVPANEEGFSIFMSPWHIFHFAFLCLRVEEWVFDGSRRVC